MRSTTMRTAAVLFALGALVLPGCSRDDTGEIFTAEAAQDAAQKFHEALVKGDVKAIVPLCRVPFRYKEPDRAWRDAASLEANLAKEVPRVQHLLPGLDRIEVFSRTDLLAGRWPRKREVPEEKRQSEIDRLGIEPFGWLARVHSEVKPGYLLVLNSEGATRLLVQFLDI